MSNQNRIQSGVREGGQFATQAKAEPHTSLTQTSDSVSARIGKHMRRYAKLIDEAERRLAADREVEIQLRIAQTVEELPAEAHTIQLIRWDEEVNEYGSYDISLGEVLDADGQEIGHAPFLGISLRGGQDSPNNWGEPFGVDNESPSLSVAAVRKWSRTLA